MITGIPVIGFENIIIGFISLANDNRIYFFYHLA